MRRIHALIAVCLFLAACKDGTDPVDDTFDKVAMLKNIGNEVVQPNYSGWLTAMNQLDSDATLFDSNPTAAQLQIVQSSFIDAYKKWESCSVFEIGPAADNSMRTRVNTFPSDTAQIELNVASGDYDLDVAKNADANGFASLDYLLFHESESLLSDPNRMTYLLDNVQRILIQSVEVSDKWASYQSEFEVSTTSSAGGSISNLVNEINFEFELFKNARIGIPLGKKTLGVTQAHKLEGYYSNRSSDLAIENLRGIQDAFNGSTGLGFDDYLNSLKATKDGADLSNAINDLFDQIAEDLNGIDLTSTIESNPTDLETMYNRIEQLVVLLKVDMPSKLGVQITYQDNDGD
jgi:uncharacterized protein